jgi:hypothetical protein
MEHKKALDEVLAALSFYHLRGVQLGKGLIPDKRKAKGILISDSGERALQAIGKLKQLYTKEEKKDDDKEKDQGEGRAAVRRQRL